MKRHIKPILTFAAAQPAAVAAMLAFGLGGWAFLSIADEVAEGETHGVDFAILAALRVAGSPDQPVGPSWLHLAAADLTALGSVTVLSLIVLTVAGLYLATRKPAGALVLLAAAGGGVLVSQGLKGLFGRERPPFAYHAVEASNPSFPSGHALLSAVVFLSLGALAARFAKRRRVKAYLIGAAVLATVLIGLTRIYLGVHWASDVLAGWCVGAAWACAWWLAAWAWERWRGPIETRGDA